MSSVCFEPEASSIGKWLHIQLGYRTFHMQQYKQSAYTDACKTYYTITVYSTVYLKMNPRFGNMQKT